MAPVIEKGGLEFLFIMRENPHEAASHPDQEVK
jgi:hypothetical protein